MKGRRGRNRDGQPTTEKQEYAVSTGKFTVIWTPDDLRAAARAARAAAAPEYDTTAPVIDIKTRKRIG